jgi:hypothetical protein
MKDAAESAALDGRGDCTKLSSGRKTQTAKSKKE